MVDTTVLSWAKLDESEILIGDVVILKGVPAIITADNMPMGDSFDVLVGIERPIPLSNIAPEQAISSWSSREWTDDDLRAWLCARSPHSADESADAIIQFMKEGRAT